MEKLFVVIVLIVVVVLLMQFGLVWRMQKQVGKIAPDISALLGRSPAADERLLVYFHSQHCHACKPMTPLVEKMHQQHDNVLSINITDQPQLARDFGITATPTIAIIESNKISSIRAGTLRQKQLEQLLDPKTSDA